MRSAGFRAAFDRDHCRYGDRESVKPSAARADSGIIHISVLKGGWFVGASGGSGTLFFHGHRYPLSIGGLSAGLVFGASHTYLSGRVSSHFPDPRMWRASTEPAARVPRSASASRRSC